MELNEYQQKAMTTCMPSSNNFAYMMLNLVGEVGELSSKVAKAIRKEQMYVGDLDVPNVLAFYGNQPEEKRDDISNELKKEAGDILWQLAGLCHVMGWSLEDVGQQNIDKLASRKQRGVIDGDGDNR